MEEVRVPLPLPIIIPIAALVLIAAATFGFSRILLAIPKEAATAIALVMALNVLGACTFIALRPKLSRTSLIELLIVVLYPVVIGIVLTQVTIGTGEAEASKPATASESQTGGTSLTASGLKWSSDTLTVTAGKEATIHVENKDTAAHNFSVYEDSSATKDIFKGPQVAPGASQDYSFTAPAKGDYYFQCDIHPSMHGTLTVK
jgi:plastocyanin